MTLQTFFTLLVIGGVAGLVATLVSKNKKPGLVLNLVMAIAGAFAGWFVFTQVSRTALQVLFALGGSLSLLWLGRALQK